MLNLGRKWAQRLENSSVVSWEDYSREVLNKKLPHALWRFLEYYIQGNPSNWLFLVLPKSSIKASKCLSQNSRNIAFCHFSFISNQIPNLFAFTFSCIRIFPTISIVTVCVCVCVCVCVLFSHVWLFATPWTVACQAPMSMEFSKQEYWSGLLFLSLGNLLPPGVEPRSPALQTDSWPSEPPRSPSIFTTIAPNNAFFLRTLKVIHWIVLQCELFFHVNAFYTLFDISIANSDHSLLSLKSMTVHTAN